MPIKKKGKQGFQPITSNEVASVLAYLVKAQAPFGETVVLTRTLARDSSSSVAAHSRSFRPSRCSLESTASRCRACPSPT